MSSSNEVDSAVGEGPARSLKGKNNTEQSALEQRAAELRRLVEEPSGKEKAAQELATIERQLADGREATAKQAAAARMVGIRRAFGSVTSSIDADEQRVGEKIEEVSGAITRLNDRYSQAVQLRAEAAALADRFSLPKPTLPDVAPPARRELAITLALLPNTLLATAWGSQPTEECEHKMRTRRTYAEAVATPGAEIIERAGLKPFPELTERQREIIAAREREKEQERRAFASLPKIPSDGSIPLGSL